MGHGPLAANRTPKSNHHAVKRSKRKATVAFIISTIVPRASTFFLFLFLFLITSEFAGARLRAGRKGRDSVVVLGGAGFGFAVVVSERRRV